MFQLLTISALGQVLLESTLWVLISHGQSARLLREMLIFYPIMLGSFALGLPFGIKGVAFSLSIALLCVIPWILKFAFHNTNLTLPRLCHALVGPIVLSAIGAYTSNVLIAHDSAFVERFSIEWGRSGQSSALEQLLRDGTALAGVACDEHGIRVLAELPPGASHTFSLVYRNDYAALAKAGFIWDAHAFLRRRLSEVRDNYLSKNQHVLTAAKALQRHLLK